MKALRSFLYSDFKENAILAKAFSFWLALLQRDLTWSKHDLTWGKSDLTSMTGNTISINTNYEEH